MTTDEDPGFTPRTNEPNTIADAVALLKLPAGWTAAVQDAAPDAPWASIRKGDDDEIRLRLLDGMWSWSWLFDGRPLWRGYNGFLGDRQAGSSQGSWYTFIAELSVLVDENGGPPWTRGLFPRTRYPRVLEEVLESLGVMYVEDGDEDGDG